MAERAGIKAASKEMKATREMSAFKGEEAAILGGDTETDKGDKGGKGEKGEKGEKGSERETGNKSVMPLTEVNIR